jgi:tripartite-type tricarboxylate transporter receptor subunit TctC
MNIARFLGAAALICMVATSAFAQNFPTKPLRMLVGFLPGSTTDVIGRLLAQKMGEGLGQQVVMDNRPGAGANIAAELVAKAPPDGYAMLMANAGIAVSASAYAKLNYNALRDLTPVTQVSTTPHILIVHPSLPVKSVKELIAFAKARPGQLNYSSGGMGNSDHIAPALFCSMTGLDMVHVPHKGGPQAAADVISGQVMMYFAGVPVGLPLAKAGKVKAMAVTSAKRAAVAPDVPTLAEAGVTGYEHTLWGMLLVPSATPKDVVARLNRETVKALESAELRERYATMGVEPVGTPSEQASAYLKSEIAKYAKVVKAIGLKMD